MAIAIAFESGLVLAGLLLLWRLVLSGSARASRTPAALTAWDVAPSDLLLFLLLVICGGVAFEFGAIRLAAHYRLALAPLTILAGSAFQLGMLTGIAVFFFGFPAARDRSPPAPARPLVSGAATFLIAMPVLIAVSALWQGLLQLFGLPTEKQDLIDLFANTHSPALRAVLVVLAIVVAPTTEELIFRRGLFRYFRGRVPRWLALGGPALIFGALHVSWTTLDGLGALGPLVALGIVFSLAYERTGRIGTTMVAHALFNLNTVILIFAGVNI